MPKYKYDKFIFKNKTISQILKEINENQSDWWNRGIVQIEKCMSETTVIYREQIKEKPRENSKDKQILQLEELLTKAYNIIGENEIKSTRIGCTFDDAIDFRKEARQILKLNL